MVPSAVAVVAAIAGGLVDVRGLLAIILLACASLWARRARTRVARAVAHVMMLGMCAALFTHIVPGFANPRILDAVVLSSDSQPYTKYLSFDKGIAGLFLLGIYAPERVAEDKGLARGFGLLWRFGFVVGSVVVLALGFHYLRWDPKLPEWWPMWTWSMVFLTALPEEALFRGVVQEQLQRWLEGRTQGTMLAILMASLLFGVAHAAGGVAYVILAAIAGIAYGWVYATARSVSASILAHTTLNTLHFIFFSYPALART